MMQKRLFAVLACGLVACEGMADKSLVQVDASPYAAMRDVDLDQVVLSGGFWKERQDVNRTVSLELLWRLATDEQTEGMGHVLNNFKVAAGLKQGRHQGVAWQDEWMYKWIEAACYTYASTGDKTLLARIDSVVPVIAQAQEADGYIATQVSAGKFKARWLSPLNHELYNMGHLLTAGAVHYRMTGQTNLVEVANKAAAFCLKQFKAAPEVMWEYPLNPSIIMGAVELYRATGNPEALELAKHIVDLRGSTYQGTEEAPEWGRKGGKDDYEGGSDLYQNYIPLRRETEVLGHAVFFTYLYAGAADVYLETGDKTLLEALERLWADLTGSKMYITGGVSPVHTGLVTRSFKPGERKILRGDEISEGIAAPFELPNTTAYNETCGMLGNMMWNWRMLLATGDARYAEVMELSWFNSILAGMELGGDHWSYTNPLRWNGCDHECRSHDRHKRDVPGIDRICCPLNLLRNLAAYNGYLYARSDQGVWVHHYAASDLDTRLPDGTAIKLKQETDYPWNGRIRITLDCAGQFAIKPRIPSWAEGASVKLNGKKLDMALPTGSYADISRAWKKGDVLELNFPMEVNLMTGDSRIESTRGQVAVKRGPVVYCLESNDIPAGVDIANIKLPLDARWQAEYRPGLLSGVTVLATEAVVEEAAGSGFGPYRAVGDMKSKKVRIEMIPYFAWNNRAEPEMTVWLEAK